MKITQKELQYIKDTISPEQLIDLVSLKAKMNQRQIKTGRKINESEEMNESQTNIESTGFPKFYDNMDDKTKNMFNEVFNIFKVENSGSNIQGKVYSLFQKFLSTADKYIAEQAD